MQQATPPHRLSGGWSGTVFLLANVLCWSAVPVVLRYLTGSLDAWTANGVRYPFAAVLFWPTLAWARRSGMLDRATLIRCLVPAALAFGGQIFWALAPYYLPAGAIGFLLRFSLVFALAGSMILFRDERRLLRLPVFHLGLGLSIAGFIALSVSKMRWDAEVGVTGIVIILLCGLFFGFYGVSVRHFLHGINPLISFGIVSQFVSAGTLAAMFLLGDWHQLARIERWDWLLLVTSSTLGVALGHHFLYSAVARLGAAVTSGAQTAAPFITMLWASWFLGESMRTTQWLAGTTMVIGAGLLIIAQQQLVRRHRGAKAIGQERKPPGFRWVGKKPGSSGLSDRVPDVSRANQHQD